MVHRNPDITAASITKRKPKKSNSVSFATASLTCTRKWFSEEDSMDL